MTVHTVREWRRDTCAVKSVIGNRIRVRRLQQLTRAQHVDMCRVCSGSGDRRNLAGSTLQEEEEEEEEEEEDE
jgi:hypothetical protein